MKAEYSITFRPDVEGLRALAVLLVLAFHNGWAGIFSGGFVGVDVFFVISGYLITQHIAYQAQNGSFSFRDFYIRRARRLFPALFLTVALTVVISIVISPPTIFRDLGASAIASIFSVSNIYFLLKVGYFDATTIQKPLLHTWSLAVEDQFYLVWPLLIVMLLRFFPRRWHVITSLAFIAALSVWVAEAVIDRNTAAAFYLTPCRMAEFVAGALCVWLPVWDKQRLWLREIFSLLGIGLILYAAFFFIKEMRFPGLSALLPCLGTALLIYFSGSKVSRLLLANPLAVGIGRISYSLYLLHWPAYLFSRQWKGGELSQTESLAVCAISMLLATMMYQYIEQPFRRNHTEHGPVVGNRAFFKMIASSMIGIVFISGMIWSGRGWGWRFPSDLGQMLIATAAEKDARFLPFIEHCMSGRGSCDSPTATDVNVFIVGDSHAPDAFNALISQYPDYHYVFKGLAGCPPLVRENYDLMKSGHPGREKCIARNEALLYGDQLAQADLIVINTLFNWYRPEHLELSIAQIHKITQAPIVVLGNYLYLDEDLPDLISRQGTVAMNDYYAKHLAMHVLAFDTDLEVAATKLGFTYISKRKLFCTGPSIMDCPLVLGGKLFTYDRHHLSLGAANALGAALKAKYSHIFFQSGS